MYIWFPNLLFSLLPKGVFPKIVFPKGVFPTGRKERKKKGKKEGKGFQASRKRGWFEAGGRIKIKIRDE